MREFEIGLGSLTGAQLPDFLTQTPGSVAFRNGRKDDEYEYTGSGPEGKKYFRKKDKGGTGTAVSTPPEPEAPPPPKQPAQRPSGVWNPNAPDTNTS